MIPIILSATLMTTPDGCKISMKRSIENGKIYEAMHVENPDECPEKAFTRYINCTNNLIPLEKRPKECQ